MKILNISSPKRLTYKLPDKRSNVFIRARVYRSSDNQLSEEVSLSHISNGFYAGIGTFGEGEYNVIYETFKDALFNSPLRVYEDKEEFIRVENINQTIISESDRVIGLMDDSDGRATCS